MVVGVNEAGLLLFSSMLIGCAWIFGSHSVFEKGGLEYQKTSYKGLLWEP